MVVPLVNLTPDDGAPLPSRVTKLRPYLTVVLVLCSGALICKFIGLQQSTALTDIFPIIFGFAILYSRQNFHTCLIPFTIVAGIASVFGLVYLISDVANPTIGRGNFFAETCKKSIQPDGGIDARRIVKICGNPYDPANDSTTCSSHAMSCFHFQNKTRISLPNGGYLYTDKDVKDLYFERDFCSVFTIVGHAALIAAFVFNTITTYIAWRMYSVTRDSTQAQLEMPLTDNLEDGTHQPNMREMVPVARIGANSTTPFQAFQGHGQTLGST